MKPVNLFKIAALSMLLVLGACKSSKSLEKPGTAGSGVVADAQGFLQKVSDNAQTAKFVTSKIKFQVQIDSKDISLSGNLKMKRDDVIRLQLMAFGFVEAGRLEFTKDYVLVMDRINKQYIKVPYSEVDFLRSSGINFHSLQALFWNELFQPGKTRLTAADMKAFATSVVGDEVNISFSRDRMSYRWSAGMSDAGIRQAKVVYRDTAHGNTELDWNYTDFKPFASKRFPTANTVTLKSPSGKDVKLNIRLNNIGSDSDWETRTEVSSKYKPVKMDDILRRLKAL